MKIGNTTIGISGWISQEDYEKNQNEIDSSAKLRFYNYKDDLNLRLQNIKRDSLNYYLILLIIALFLIILSVLTRYKSLGNIVNITLQAVAVICIVVLPCFVILFVRDTLISKYTKISIFIFPIPTLLYIFFLYKMFDPSAQYRILGFIAMSILLFFVTDKFIRFLPLYMIDTYNKNITIFLTIFTLIFGPDLTSDCSMVLLSYLLNITLTQICLDLRLETCHSEAEEIFEKILLDDHEVAYDDLLKCYAKGGNKYREKILGNKQFLKVITDIEKKK